MVDEGRESADAVEIGAAKAHRGAETILPPHCPRQRIPLKATTCSGEDDHPSERSDDHRLMVGWGGRL